MKMMKKNFVAYQGEDGFVAKQNAEGTLKEVKFAVVKPSQRVQAKAQEMYNKRFAELLKSGTLVVAELDKEMTRRELWDKERQKEAEALTKKILDAETVLLKGGIKKSEGKKVAIQLIKDRAELIKLTSEKSRLRQESAEGQAENSRFNYLVYACTVYDTDDKAGQKYFNSYEDYLESEDPIMGLAAQHLMNLLYDVVEAQKTLPEYRFLEKYGFVNSRLQFINAEGKLTDEEGRLINDDGRFINEKGDFVDRDGKRVSEDGTPLVEFTEFLED